MANFWNTLYNEIWFCLWTQIHGTGDFLKLYSLLQLWGQWKKKRRKWEKASNQKKKKKEKLKEKSLEWVADNLFSAWSHLPLIQVCFWGNRFDVLLCLQYILQNDWWVISVSQLGPKYWSDKTDLSLLQNDSTRERGWSHQSRGTEDSSFPRKECQGIKLNPK